MSISTVPVICSLCKKQYGDKTDYWPVGTRATRGICKKCIAETIAIILICLFAAGTLIYVSMQLPACGSCAVCEAKKTILVYLK